uniref:ATP synthase subunit a n=1 Tax=Laeonereis culveri TaxID=1859080 RepID=A0A1B0ZEZ6_9ANNE|nr:ATP synthase subunit 6 [Laeonereis culveri]
MMDIFSSFDPGINMLNSISPSIFWLMIMTTTMLFSLSLWVSPSSMVFIMNIVMNTMSEQCNRTQGMHIKSFNLFLTSLFIIIIMINFMGLLPAVFSFSSHLIFTLSFGLPLWMSLIISAMNFNFTSWMASLLPSGAPHWLNPFLVIIESISISVRPLTLSFRLAANMSAGHIVLTLIGCYCAAAMFSSMTSTSILFLIQLGYIMFEMGICLIQSYIFCLLLSLYSDDHP